MSAPASDTPQNAAAGQAPPNADAHELAKFDAMAQRWWDPEGEAAPLHRINPLRLGYVMRRATLPGARAVDVGCGGGLLAEALARAGARTTGIDLAPAALQAARLHALESGIQVDYREISAEALADTEPAAFDVAWHEEDPIYPFTAEQLAALTNFRTRDSSDSSFRTCLSKSGYQNGAVFT